MQLGLHRSRLQPEVATSRKELKLFEHRDPFRLTPITAAWNFMIHIIFIPLPATDYGLVIGRQVAPDLFADGKDENLISEVLRGVNIELPSSNLTRNIGVEK
jgi:hypothetical protein